MTVAPGTERIELISMCPYVVSLEHLITVAAQHHAPSPRILTIFATSPSSRQPALKIIVGDDCSTQFRGFAQQRRESRSLLQVAQVHDARFHHDFASELVVDSSPSDDDSESL
jgi:hypothetical protein